MTPGEKRSYKGSDFTLLSLGLCHAEPHHFMMFLVPFRNGIHTEGLNICIVPQSSKCFFSLYRQRQGCRLYCCSVNIHFLSHSYFPGRNILSQPFDVKLSLVLPQLHDKQYATALDLGLAIHVICFDQ